MLLKEAEGESAIARDLRIAIIASGGLSHFIIDEEIDRALLDGLMRKDREALAHLPLDEVLQVRGEADAVALKLRYHSERAHRETRPREQMAREVFDAKKGNCSEVQFPRTRVPQYRVLRESA